jgi:peptide/nickel transport system permease protein
VLRYLIKRFLWALALLVAITFVTFLVFRVVPGNPAELAAGPSASPADVKRVERALELDRPVYIQYAKFIWRLVGHGSLGRSFATREDVNDVVLDAAPVTAAVVLGGMTLLLLVSIPTGTLCATRPRSAVDRLATVCVLIGVSVPVFLMGLLLQYLIGFRLGWSPIAGYCDFFNSPPKACGRPAKWASHLVLPWITLAAYHAALYVRIVRSTVMETMTADFVRTARAKGARDWRVMRSHVLRNSMLPITTLIGLDLGLLLGGAVFVERVFGLPGLGQAALEAIQARDYPITEGIVLFGAAAIVLSNLIVDLVYARLDPQITME